MACSPCFVATRVLDTKLSASARTFCLGGRAVLRFRERPLCRPSRLAGGSLEHGSRPFHHPSGHASHQRRLGHAIHQRLAAHGVAGHLPGPASPDTAPETAPTTADCAISPNEVGLPCTALETTVVATLIAAPITAPRIIVHSGQQCPLGSLRVSGLSPT